MKKIFATLMAMALMLTLAVTAFADDSKQVYVTIADENGELALAYESITVTDADGDGALTINDALYCAHEAKYDGGAAAGYGSINSDYGLSMSKLWGAENGGSYGYYLNNASAWSLTDAVNNGDHIVAYAYTDLTAWSDTYCYFNKAAVSAESDEEITLNLSYAGYDESWNPVTLPCEGAVVTVNGEATEYVTDADGNVTVKLNGKGTYVLSAISSTQTLVPPVCVVTVSEASSPETGIVFTASLLAISLCTAVIFKKYEK